jgi:hypothetical protein
MKSKSNILSLLSTNASQHKNALLAIVRRNSNRFLIKILVDARRTKQKISITLGAESQWDIQIAMLIVLGENNFG